MDNLELLEKSIEAMKTKIEQKTEEFKLMELSQQVTVGTGETILSANPAIQEYRALVRDYASALKALEELKAKQKGTPQVNSVEEMRKRLKVAK